MGLTPPNGGSRSDHIFVGAGLGELRPDCKVGGSIAYGMVEDEVVVNLVLNYREMPVGRVKSVELLVQVAII